MAKYFFTYGSDDANQPFQGGWTEVEATYRALAYAAFKVFHPKTEDGFLPFCECYSAEEFAATSMSGEKGNFGQRCHERIVLQREMLEGSVVG